MNRSIVRFLLTVLILFTLCFSASAQEADFIGRWYLITYDDGETVYNMADLQYEVIYEFFEDGVATVTLNGKTETTAWLLENGAPLVIDNNIAFAFQQNGDRIEMLDGGALLSYGREPGTVPGNQTVTAEFVPTGAITIARKYDYMGVWRLTSIEHNGFTYTGEAMGRDLSFLFSSYTSAGMITNGETRYIPWSIQDGAIVTNSPSYRFMPDGEKLVVLEEGQLMTFERDLSASVHAAPWGSAKRLEGRSLVVSIFVTLDRYSWNSKGIAAVRGKLKTASEYICDKGTEYGKDVELVYDFDVHPDLRYDMRFEGPFHEKPNHDNPLTEEERREEDMTYQALERFVEENVPYRALAEKYQTDSIAYVVHVNKRARSYAFSYNVGSSSGFAEVAVVFNDTPALYAHEILHLFGAVDFYRAEEKDGVSAEVVAYVKQHFPKDIMVVNYGKDGKITNELTRLTALGLGWLDDVPELEQFPKLKSSIPGAYTTRNEELRYQSDEYVYTLKDGEATLIEYLIRFENEAVIIPDTVDGYPVTGIGELVFIDYQVNPASIAIPAGVTYIEGNPFSYCDSLAHIEVALNNPVYALIDGVLFNKIQKTLVAYNPAMQSGARSYAIPQGVEGIGNEAFRNCKGLSDITIPDSVALIGDGAFYGCADLNSVTLPNSVTSIGSGAFSHCTSLANVTIPDSITSLGNSAFSYCGGLTAVTLPEGLSSVGDHLFYSCGSLTNVRIPDSVTSIGKGAFEYCALTSMTIPNGVTSIAPSIFAYCSGLLSCSIPEGVTGIGMAAFYGCTGLTSLTIPAGVQEVEERAFMKCPNLALSVTKGSYGEKYARDNGIPYVYTGK